PLAERHPLLEEAIAAEAALLAPLRPYATHEVDTSHLSVHDLRRRVDELLPSEARPELHVGLLSFGFKHGLPYEADTVVDVRFLPNPYFVPELRDHTGLEPAVAEYVLRAPDAQAFLRRLEELLEFLLPRYRREGKAYFTFAVGCTGGRHRSVAIVEALAARLRAQGQPLTVRHRDIDR
ncbi:MAG: RNase adaptor protein RapZ, partial [Nitrospirae bacterium]